MNYPAIQWLTCNVYLLLYEVCKKLQKKKLDTHFRLAFLNETFDPVSQDYTSFHEMGSLGRWDSRTSRHGMLLSVHRANKVIMCSTKFVYRKPIFSIRRAGKNTSCKINYFPDRIFFPLETERFLIKSIFMKVKWISF